MQHTQLRMGNKMRNGNLRNRKAFDAYQRYETRPLRSLTLTVVGHTPNVTAFQQCVQEDCVTYGYATTVG